MRIETYKNGERVKKSTCQGALMLGLVIFICVHPVVTPQFFAKTKPSTKRATHPQDVLYRRFFIYQVIHCWVRITFGMFIATITSILLSICNLHVTHTHIMMTYYLHYLLPTIHFTIRILHQYVMALST